MKSLVPDFVWLTALSTSLAALAALAIAPLTSCSSADVGGSRAAMKNSSTLKPQKNTRGSGSQLAPISDAEFRGVTHGTSLADLKERFGQNLNKGVESNGEGDFDYYGLTERGTEIIRFFLSDADKVNAATTQNPAFKTDKGVGVGSTLADLRSAYPDIEIHGSEIEGRTTATSVSAKGISFDIGSHFWHRELSEAEVASIPPGTRIESITILTGRF